MANFRAGLRHVASGLGRVVRGLFGPTHRTTGTPPSRSVADDFVYGGELLFVHSSNVAAAQYFWGEHKMMIEFLNGSAYLYSSVNETEAWTFATAGSKGGWVWDNLRVRGTVDQHRKPYERIK